MCVLHRHEAAYKLTSNAEAVAKFACRGAGRGSGWNLLPGRAPLSDPNAVPNMEILADVDNCLRRVRFRVLSAWKDSLMLSSSRLESTFVCAVVNGAGRTHCFQSSLFLCSFSSGGIRFIEGLAGRRYRCAQEWIPRKWRPPRDSSCSSSFFGLPQRPGKNLRLLIVADRAAH